MYIKEIESIIKSPPKQKVLSPDGFTGKFYWNSKDKIMENLYNLFQSIEAEGILPNLFYEARISITLIAKLDKDIIRKLQTNISHECRCKNPQENISKSIPTIYKKNFTSWPRGIHPKYVRLVQHLNIS